MKVRFEPQKTTLRLSKDELSHLLNQNELLESTTFPGGGSLNFHLSLDDAQSFNFDDDCFTFTLPDKLIRNYRPSKSGIIFEFQLDSKNIHQLLFEVDIKKKPLNS